MAPAGQSGLLQARGPHLLALVYLRPGRRHVAPGARLRLNMRPQLGQGPNKKSTPGETGVELSEEKVASLGRERRSRCAETRDHAYSKSWIDGPRAGRCDADPSEFRAYLVPTRAQSARSNFSGELAGLPAGIVDTTIERRRDPASAMNSRAAAAICLVERGRISEKHECGARAPPPRPRTLAAPAAAASEAAAGLGWPIKQARWQAKMIRAASTSGKTTVRLHRQCKRRSGRHLCPRHPPDHERCPASVSAGVRWGRVEG